MDPQDVLIEVVTGFVKTIIFYPYFQRLQVNGILKRMKIQNQRISLMVVIKKYGGYVLKDMSMMLQLVIEQLGTLVALTAIMTKGNLPEI